MREDTKAQADREGTLIIREAQAEADRLVDEARVAVRKMERQVDALERLRRSYVVQMKKMAEQQLAELTAAELLPLPAHPTPIDPAEAVDDAESGGSPK